MEIPGRFLPPPDISDSVSQYLAGPLNPLELPEIVDGVVKLASAFNFEAIAFSGISGALVAPLVAVTMQKGLLLVRKPNEVCHSKALLEGFVAAKSYLIVDDFVMNGASLRWMTEKIHQRIGAKCEGAILYSLLDETELELVQKDFKFPIVCLRPPASRTGKDFLKRMVWR